MILGIDPGKDTGWAVLDDSGLLTMCGLGEPPRPALNTKPFDLVVIERPKIYNASTAKANPDDIITLAICVGRYVERFTYSATKIKLPSPAEWKGQVPKAIHNARVLSVLTMHELHNAGLSDTPKGKHHNVIDAIGIAKWAFRTCR